MFAAIDLGSNSFRLHIGNHDGTEIQVIKTARSPVHLAAGLDDQGYLTDEAIARALDCLAEFRRLLSTFPITAARVVATNTLRVAKNAAQFLPSAEKIIGYPIEIISGEEEGRLIYMGVSHAVPFADKHTGLVIDIGGGSTEVILGRGKEILEVESFSIGTYPQHVGFFKDGYMTDEAFDAAITSARSLFEDATEQYNHPDINGVYGSSGTIRAIGTAIARSRIGDGSLSYANLMAFKNYLVKAGHVAHVTFAGVKPERIAVIASGLSILLGIMRQFNLRTIETTVAGLRMGVLWDLHLRSTDQDRRTLAIAGFMRKFHVDVQRAQYVASNAVQLFRQLVKGKPQFDDNYLCWAALVHEVGICVSHSNVHKHSAYMVENADLPGFTKREQSWMSTLVLGQKGNLKKIDKSLQDPAFALAVLSLRLAALCLHAKVTDVADALMVNDHESKGMVVTLRKSYPTLAYALDKEQESWRAVGVNLAVNAL
jgi:exopolyphosphatase/guanosine-5'-triphosphate,3'-diphosphate pyrophosphatase